MQNQEDDLITGHQPYVVEDSYAMVHRNEVAVKKEGNVSDHLVLCAFISLSLMSSYSVDRFP